MTHRIVLWCIVIVLLAYDVAVAYSHRPTITDAIREADADTQGLVRWGLLALWLHLFIPLWRTTTTPGAEP